MLERIIEGSKTVTGDMTARAARRKRLTATGGHVPMRTFEVGRVNSGTFEPCHGFLMISAGGMMSNSRQPRDSKKRVGSEGREMVIKDNAPDSQAALPPGTLKGPFLERHGDEQRRPS
jgi:hypothetical protein